MEARLLLGVPEAATLAQAEAAYKMRAQVLHPDKHTNASPEVKAEADRAMKQLNEALAVLRRTADEVPPPRTKYDGGPSAAGRARPQPGSSRDNSRMPASDECMFCGCRPATPVTLRRVSAFILFYRTALFQNSVCRNCGLNVYSDMQTATLFRGWWGPIAALRTLFVLLANLRQRRRLAILGAPTRRRSDLNTPLTSPPRIGPSPRRRSGAYVGPAAAAALVGGLILTPSWATDGTTGPEAPAAQAAEPVEAVETEPTTRRSVAFDSVTVGECYDDADTRLWATACNVPHDYFIYERFDLDAGAWPGEAEVERRANERCAEEVPARVVAMDDVSYNFWIPTADGWALNDREILCTLVATDGGKLTAGVF